MIVISMGCGSRVNKIRRRKSDAGSIDIFVRVATLSHSLVEPFVVSDIARNAVAHPCTLNVLPLAVFRSFSSFSGRARFKTCKKSAVLLLILEWINAFDALIW